MCCRINTSFLYVAAAGFSGVIFSLLLVMTYVIDVDTLSYVSFLYFPQNLWSVFCSSEMVRNRLPHSDVRAYPRRQFHRTSLWHSLRLPVCLWISELDHSHALSGSHGEELPRLAAKEVECLCIYPRTVCNE